MAHWPLKSGEIAAIDRRLGAHVRNRLANAHDAEDIVQESWLRIGAVAGSGSIASLRGYLFRIAQNLVVDHHRRVAARPEVAVDAEILHAVPDPRPNAEAQLITRDELRRMDRIIAAMPDRPRAVFRLSRIEGLSLAEIGRRLGISRQTAHEHLTRALLAIQLAAETDFDAQP